MSWLLAGAVAAYLPSLLFGAWLVREAGRIRREPASPA